MCYNYIVGSDKMYFVNKIKEEYRNKDVILFLDMDGVITDYDVGRPLDFKHKRPLMTNIKTFQILSEMPNLLLYVLSICKKDYQIEEKNEWLDKYAPFIQHENRIILSKESYPFKTSSELKYDYLKDFIRNVDSKTVIMVDDDNAILKKLQEIPGLVLFQDSSLID